MSYGGDCDSVAGGFGAGGAGGRVAGAGAVGAAVAGGVGKNKTEQVDLDLALIKRTTRARRDVVGGDHGRGSCLSGRAADAGCSVVRLVMDTNLIVSATLWDGKPFELLSAVQERGFEIFTSEPLLEELRSVLIRPKMQKQLLRKRLTASGVLTRYKNITRVVDPMVVGRVAADPDDDLVLGTAKAARADLIVSGDRHLLILEQFEGIPILTAAEALARL